MGGCGDLKLADNPLSAEAIELAGATCMAGKIHIRADGLMCVGADTCVMT